MDQIHFPFPKQGTLGHLFPSGLSTRIVGEGISPLCVAYASLCKYCTLVYKNIVFPQTSKEIWNRINSFVKVPCLGNGKIKATLTHTLLSI
jgi:hypothetical protein